ncbi:MAG: hypothetical protein V1913_09295 [Fibrobacterota bacterium]
MVLFNDPAVYEFVRGPLASLAFMVCGLGFVFQIIRFRLLTKNADWPSAGYPDTRPQLLLRQPHTFRLRLMYAFIGVKSTAIGRQPVMTLVSFVFHGCLFFAPLLLVGHNILLNESFGVSLFSLSEKTCDRMTVLFMACVLFFLMRRLFLARVRAISSFYDYLVLALAFMPFLTGFLAYHQIYNYRTIIILHMFSGELMIMALPYTKLMHAIYFFFMRFVLPGESSFKRGKRVWNT